MINGNVDAKTDLKRKPTYVNMANHHEETWKTLVETVLDIHKHADVDVALLKAFKRGKFFSKCCLCQGSVDVWLVEDDNKYCRSCHKLRFEKCDLCSGSLDWHTLVRKDTCCSECFYALHGKYSHKPDFETSDKLDFS